MYLSFGNNSRPKHQEDREVAYRLYQPTVFKRWLDHTTCSFKAWNKSWKWVLAVSMCQIVSAYTNVKGLELFLPTGLAVLAGIGLQIIALYIGSHLIHGNHQGRWPATLIFIVGLSGFFSFMGFSSTYRGHVAAKVEPALERKELAASARTMAERIGEAKALVNEKLNNRVRSARAIIAQITSQQSQGQYADPVAAANAIAVQRAKISEAYAEQRQWRDFVFKANDVLGQPTVRNGYDQLDGAYNKLTTLVGTLSRAELGDYELPDPALPAPSKDPEDADRVGEALGAITSMAGFFILCLAIGLEAAPFALARFLPMAGSESQGQLYLPDSEVPSRGPADKKLIAELTAANNRVRVLHFVGPNGPAEVERQIARTEPLSEALRQAFLECEWSQISDLHLRRRLERRRYHLELLLEEAQFRGVPEAELSRYIELDFQRVLADFEREGMAMSQPMKEMKIGLN